jgi:hypothetical protein
MNLLIHADPGARSGLLGAWLTDRLTRPVFHVGEELMPRFVKIHKLNREQDVADFDGIKIRVRPSIDIVDRLSLLFLRKNVYVLMPDFTRDEYSLETYTKLTEFAKEILEWDAELDYSLYDHVIDFADTFDTDAMIEIYHKVHDRFPTGKMIDVLSETNAINSIQTDKNHSCSIVKMVLQREQELGLREEHRFWSVVDLYHSTPVDDLYDTIYQSIIPENYGILL